MSRSLFLDDCPTRRRWASENLAGDSMMDFAHDAPAAIEALGRIEFDVVYLDHDLGDEVYVDSSRADCGMEVVRWIVANKPKVGKFVVHTMNTPAGHAMCRALKRAGYAAKYQSFYRLYNGLPGLEGRQIL
jgi:CheY-like chemotaxis protein